MQRQELIAWMWAEALEQLQRTERLQRRHSGRQAVARLRQLC